MNNKKNTQGYSLLELLISMSLGVFIIGTTLHFFETTRKTQNIQNKLSEVRENAQFALDTIKEDIQMAGFYGCATRWDESSLTNTLNNQNDFKWNFSQALSGSEFTFDSNESTPKSWEPPLDDSIDNTFWGDTITIRNADRRELNITSHQNSTSPISITSTNTIKKNDYLLATDCEHSSIFQKTNAHSTVADKGSVEHDAGALTSTHAGNSSNDTGKKYSEATALLKLHSTSYFIRENPENIPTLFRRDSAKNAEQIITGITDMQIQYGVDTDGNEAIDAYYTANDVETNNWWDNVLIVQLSIKAEGYRDDNNKATFSNQAKMEYEISSSINLRNRLP